MLRQREVVSCTERAHYIMLSEHIGPCYHRHTARITQVRVFTNSETPETLFQVSYNLTCKRKSEPLVPSGGGTLNHCVHPKEVISIIGSIGDK
jgi:hypothetical protein